jgi:hypothetical protein
MIATCQHCHSPFWRYRKDHPHAGFCSVPHAELGPTKPPKPVPLSPAELVAMMREHRIEEHDSTSLLMEFNCQRCDELEEAYAASLLFHTSMISRDVAKEAEKRARFASREAEQQLL